MDLSGKVVVVTGASMGIGEAIAHLFAERGASVVLTSRDLERGKAARERIGHQDRTLAVACDVRRRDDLERVLALTLDRFRRVDVWVNNAGVGFMESVGQANMAELLKMFETNLFGAIEGLQVVAPVMKQQGGGTIINISSVAGHISTPYMSLYSASKAALNAAGRGARMELRRFGINVITVCPGFIATEFGKNAYKGTERMRLSAASFGIGAARVARAVLRAYLNKSREVIVPWYYRVLIAWYRTMPSVFEWGMARMLRPADQVIAESEAARKP